MAALEAALGGCNIVMTKESPAREYFGETCLVCDPDDPTSIRNAVPGSARSPTLDRAGQACARTIFLGQDRGGYGKCLCRMFGASTAKSARNVSRAVEQLVAGFSEMAALHQPWFDRMERELTKQQAWEQSLLRRDASWSAKATRRHLCCRCAGCGACARGVRRGPLRPSYEFHFSEYQPLGRCGRRVHAHAASRELAQKGHRVLFVQPHGQRSPILSQALKRWA